MSAIAFCRNRSDADRALGRTLLTNALLAPRNDREQPTINHVQHGDDR